jgi:post-segregation antitoxin (ccd killing protein)
VAGKLYERATRRCGPEELDGAVRAAIAAHAEQHQLGDVLAETVRCCETRSVRRHKPGLLARITGSGDKDVEHRTVALFTPRYLVVAVSGEIRGVHVRSARLADVSLSGAITAGMSPELAARAAELGADEGVSITARWSGATGLDATSAYFLGLDVTEGQAFRQALTEAVTAAKRA